MKTSRSSTVRGRAVAGAAASLLAILLAANAMAAGVNMMAGFPLRAGANVMLMWMPFPGATAYNVYRGEVPGGPYQKIGEVPMNMHTDMNVPTDKTFYYVIKAVVGGKEGEPSPEVAMKGLEPMVTPKFVGVLITPDNKAALRWEGNPKAAFYNLYRSDTEKGEYTLLTSVQDSKYTDGKVEVGKSYYYKVTAVSSSNVESPKADKPEVVKVEKAVAEGAASFALVNINVKQSTTYDVDGDTILRSPIDVDLLPDGGIVVVDGRGPVHIVDKEQKFVRMVGETPADYKGVWGVATGVYYEPKKKEIYVCFGNVNAIRVFDMEGKLLRTFNLAPPDKKVTVRQDYPPTPMDCILGLDGNLWVSDGSYYQFIALDPSTGKEVKRYTSFARAHPERKPGDKSLESPGFIAMNPKTGTMFVVESSAQRVTIFNKAGDYVGRFGGRGVAPGKFQIPCAVGGGDNGVFYVADKNTSQIQAFDEEGKYKGTLTLPKKQDPQQKLLTGGGANGIAARGNTIVYTDLYKERVVYYEIVP